MTAAVPRGVGRVAFVVACAALAVTAGPAIAAGQPQPSLQSGGIALQRTAPTENVTRTVQVDFYDGSTRGEFEVSVVYHARSATEAAAARNGSLNPAWFDGEQRLQQLLAETGADASALQDGTQSVDHRESLSVVGEPNRSPDHGWVILEYEATWEEYITPGEDLVIGDAYQSAFADSTAGAEWRFHVVLPSDWRVSTVNGEPVERPSGQTATAYRWSDIRQPSMPFLVVESPVAPPTTGADGSLGPASGVLVTVVALLVYGRCCHRRSG